MRHETIHKEVSEVLEILGSMETERDFLRAVNKLLKIKKKLEKKLQKKEEEKEKYGELVQHLVGWYKNLWNGMPPEYHRSFDDPDAVIGNKLKKLIKSYERRGESIEQLKRDYEDFMRSWGKGDRGILHFINALPYLKQSGQKKWTTPENERGLDYYLNAVKEKER